MKLRKWPALTVLSTVAAGMFLNGCNLTGGVDNPGGRDESLQSARARLDAGDCNGAINLLLPIGAPDFDVKQVLGWAYICRGGATIGNIGSTLFSYSSSSGDLTILGQLANSMLPGDPAKVDAMQLAYDTFASITPGDQSQTQQKAVNAGFAALIQSSAILAKASRDGIKVRKSDISTDTSCAAATCGTAPAVCSTGTNLSAADTAAFVTAVTNAGNSISGVSGLGSAADLINRVLGAQGAANLTRCFIYQNMIPN